MNKFIKQNLLTLTFSASILSLSAEAMANGMPAVECCDEIKTLDQRVKRLEDKAVEGTSKKLFIAGSINRAITWLNDGVQANTAHVDNDHWPSNITVGGEAAYNDDVTFGLNTEIRFSGNSTANNEVHNATTAANAERTVSIAVSDIYMDSKKFGRITAGHGSMSSYGTQFYADQSGAYNFFLPFAVAQVTPYRLKNAAAGFARGAASTAVIGGNVLPAYVQFTGDTPSISGRADRIMYMSPSFKGFSVGGSHGYHFRGDIWDVTAKFSGKFSGWGTVANIAFGRNHTREFDTGFIGVNGVGVKFDNISLGLGALAPFSITGKEGTGISFTFGFADRNYKQVRHKNGRSQTYALSYLDMFTDMGMTIFSVYTGEQRNMTLAPNPQNTLKSRYWMVGVQQNIDKVGTEVYAGYYRTNLKIKNSVFKFYAQDAVLVGARVKF